jgi:hypothetical protein
VASVGQNKPFFVKHRIGASFLLVPANKETAGTQQPPEDDRFVLGVAASIGQNKPFFVKHRIGASYLLVPANKETADTQQSPEDDRFVLGIHCQNLAESKFDNMRRKRGDRNYHPKASIKTKIV